LRLPFSVLLINPSPFFFFCSAGCMRKINNPPVVLFPIPPSEAFIPPASQAAGFHCYDPITLCPFSFQRLLSFSFIPLGVMALFLSPPTPRICPPQYLLDYHGVIFPVPSRTPFPSSPVTRFLLYKEKNILLPFFSLPVQSFNLTGFFWNDRSAGAMVILLRIFTEEGFAVSLFSANIFFSISFPVSDLPPQNRPLLPRNHAPCATRLLNLP